MPKHPIVIQGSSFLQARDTDALTEKERAIARAMVRMINPTDEDDKDYERPVQEWYELLGIQGSDSDFQLKDIFQNLMMK